MKERWSVVMGKVGFGKDYYHRAVVVMRVIPNSVDGVDQCSQ